MARKQRVTVAGMRIRRGTQEAEGKAPDEQGTGQMHGCLPRGRAVARTTTCGWKFLEAGDLGTSVERVSSG